MQDYATTTDASQRTEVFRQHKYDPLLLQIPSLTTELILLHLLSLICGSENHKCSRCAELLNEQLQHTYH